MTTKRYSLRARRAESSQHSLPATAVDLTEDSGNEDTIPDDSTELDTAVVIRALRGCLDDGTWLFTNYVDTVLSRLSQLSCRNDVVIRSCLSPVPGTLAPYVMKHLCPGKMSDQVSTVFVPLCDNIHYTGVVLLFLQNECIIVDSFASKKSANLARLIANRFADRFQSHDSVSYIPLYKKKVQHDGHTCGLWLLGAFISVALGKPLPSTATQFLKDKSGSNFTNRHRIITLIFGEQGICNSNDQFTFDARCNALRYHSSCAVNEAFLRHFFGEVRDKILKYVVDPVNRGIVARGWTNNNCKSLNGTYKRECDWNPLKIPKLITLHHVALRYMGDLRRSLYGSGNFALAEKFKTFRPSAVVRNE